MKRVDDKVTGATLGGTISGLATAELSRRLHVSLLPEEVAAITIVGALIGGYLKRRTEHVAVEVDGQAVAQQIATALGKTPPE